ncbi:valine--tRNA ligase, chloroplastic/mitochondrial 2-like isoform X1 [Helianthus annuus]|uniref:valine--tRNA ligase, chloroplastic/mitochondrial 2-like isoform X1 n=1 Tax=Helianthus annuus TaxID=4232 RepID=UPI00165330EB|nr:valine--tRNA ligase, chloroplastic/mitochondrial 2-like isoform X1 [Helianthus annuus]XP_035830464.1 valine--tRNA ligase, chloroplastic/mitochondrial 2-like isoform X1 [Helianthus annuus]XP_035830465.1 valine--tRNA ligase, chloroplastic/mitochondrial 2-like isoform X1 [Helianthus annuus]XP_035830466.1 valine--tRNA ligase, chloroplastic/mitochondrial 2-like isoform X1 [Helianthus annuus]XP_035830467.1 valine--tRNA ligase, chloroplastic/mitochondrial 2-like isoform X1 [Helianthus annuus]XP_03
MLPKNHAWQALPNMKEALIVSSWPLTSLPRNLAAIKRFEKLQALRNGCIGSSIQSRFAKHPFYRFAQVYSHEPIIIYISSCVRACLSRAISSSCRYGRHFWRSSTVIQTPFKMQNEYNTLVARLSSPNFVEKAPEDVVRARRHQKQKKN